MLCYMPFCKDLFILFCSLFAFLSVFHMLLLTSHCATVMARQVIVLYSMYFHATLRQHCFFNRYAMAGQLSRTVILLASCAL